MILIVILTDNHDGNKYRICKERDNTSELRGNNKNNINDNDGRARKANIHFVVIIYLPSLLYFRNLLSITLNAEYNKHFARVGILKEDRANNRT